MTTKKSFVYVVDLNEYARDSGIIKNDIKVFASLESAQQWAHDQVKIQDHDRVKKYNLGYEINNPSWVISPRVLIDINKYEINK